MTVVLGRAILLNVQYWLLAVARLKTLIDFAGICVLIYAYDLVMVTETVTSV